MKMRTLCAAILGLLLVSGLSLSQEPAFPESVSEDALLVESSPPKPVPEEPTSNETRQNAEPRGGSRTLQARRAPTARGGEMVLKIFKLEHYPAENLGRLIAEMFDVKVNSVLSNNSLIVRATNEQMDNIQSLIAKLDVESKLLESQSPDNLIYRVYMFEIPSQKQDLKPFSMILQASAQVTSATLLGGAAEGKIEVSDYAIIDERDNGQVDILLRGRAPSNESIQKIAELTGIQIRELRWDDDETFTRNLPAAHYSQLPEQMQKYIQKFLGPEIETVGYWFGSSSVPGEIEAPIGPWNLRLELNPQSDRALELRVEVTVPEELSHFDRQLGRERSDQILSNTIQVKVGKPVIVGYNRPSYGTRKMGAMVILPEVDTADVPKVKGD